MASISQGVELSNSSLSQGVSGTNSNSPVKNNTKQGDKDNFPMVMKKAKGDNGKADDAAGNGNARVNADPVLAQIADSLPLDGKLLPSGLEQNNANKNQKHTDNMTQDNSALLSPANASNLLPETVAHFKNSEKTVVGKDENIDTKSLLKRHTVNSTIDKQPSLRDKGDPASTVTARSSEDVQLKSDGRTELSGVMSQQQNKQLLAHVLKQDIGDNLLNKQPLSSAADLTTSITASNGLVGNTQLVERGNQSSAISPAISAPLRSAEWGDELSNRINWMVQHEVQSANIKINPPHLGPLEVHVTMKNDHVDVSFNSHHISVKEAIDASMPKLREMLVNNGLQLGDANVTHHSFSGNQHFNSQGDKYNDGSDYNGNIKDPDNFEAENISIASILSSKGAIDFYA